VTSITTAMPVSIPSAALGQMDEAERTRVLNAAFDSSPESLTAYLAVLGARLRVYEQRYELPTSTLTAALASGELRETADVSAWLFWADLRSQLAGKARP
jgi:hypothetical protein